MTWLLQYYYDVWLQQLLHHVVASITMLIVINPNPNPKFYYWMYSKLITTSGAIKAGLTGNVSHNRLWAGICMITSIFRFCCTYILSYTIGQFEFDWFIKALIPSLPFLALLLLWWTTCRLSHSTKESLPFDHDYFRSWVTFRFWSFQNASPWCQSTSWRRELNG